MPEIEATERTRVRRLPDRGVYDRGAIDAVLDEALVCHVGFNADDQPYVIPMVYARVRDSLYLHGSAASRLTRTLASGVPVCVTVTLLDGLVLARSAFHHSMNYRSVVVLGHATKVTDLTERLTALAAIVEHVAPGRGPEVRPPSARELWATMVLRVPLTEVSAKVRSGPPLDDVEDLDLECWAGEIPLRLQPQTLVPDPRLRDGISPSAAVTDYRRPRRS